MEIQRKANLSLQNFQRKSESSLRKNIKGTTLVNKNQCIKIKPEIIQFSDIEISHKYQIMMYIRNQSREIQKIRIIDPSQPYFTINKISNPMTIAPGLVQQIPVYFHLQSNLEGDKDIYESQIQILGNSFKKTVPLIARKPDFKLLIPQKFKLGILKQNKEQYFKIPIENYGKQDIQIGLLQSSTQNVYFEEEKIVAKKSKITNLHIKVKCTQQGPFSETIYFPNGHKLELFGICTQQKIEVLSSSGLRLLSKDFGFVYIGEKIQEKFHIVNSSPNKIQCLIKMFSRNIPDYLDIKVDENKKTFVNRQKPSKLIQQDRKVNVKCNKSKFLIEPFCEIENYITLNRLPSEQQLACFKKQSINSENKSSQGIKSYVQSLQTMYLRVVSLDKAIKIPIKYTPIIPKIYVNKHMFQFQKTESKCLSYQLFTVKNENQKQIEINFCKKGIFYIDGKNKILPGCTNQYKICFQPLIIGDYTDFLKISVFNIWQLQLKVYGQCGKTQKTQKENFRISKSGINNKSMPLINSALNKTNNANFLASQRKKRHQKIFANILQNKLSERGINKTSNLDVPLIDLAFDALENPKVKETKKMTLNSMTSELFYKVNQSSSGLKSLKQHRMIKNTSDIFEELTINELGKVQIRCDDIDFGNIFIGSSNRKQINILNKNTKPIHIQFNLYGHQCLSETNIEPKIIEPYGDCKFNICLKPQQLGNIRIPISYSINKLHVFELDIIANITLLNLGFSAKSLTFSFEPNQCIFEKTKNILVSNYGNTITKFIIMQPNNKCFTVVSPKEQQIYPNSEVPISIRYKPIQSSQKGQEVFHQDKIIVKVIGGAENIIRVKGSVLQPKFSVKESQIMYQQIFICTVLQGKINLRNHSKVQSAVKIEFNPPDISEYITIDQKQFLMNAEERKQVSYELHSDEVKEIRGNIIIRVRGGKIFKVPVYLNFCFPKAEIINNESNNIDLGTVHILSNHVERQIKVINRMKNEIKLEINKLQAEKEDYNLEITATNETVELSLERESETDDQVIIKQIITSNKAQNVKEIQNTQKLAKIFTLYPGVVTNLLIKFIPKAVKEYSFTLPFYLHKATKDIKPIKQAFKCRAVEPLFYVNPYHIYFDNCIVSQNQMAHWKSIELVNPRLQEINWEIQFLRDKNSLFFFSENSGKLNAKQKKTLLVYFKPTQEGAFEERIKFKAIKTHQISVEIVFSGTAVAPRVVFNKNNLILTPVPLDTETRGIVWVENQGYETLTFTKWKLLNQHPNVFLDVNFLDGKIISLAKKKIRVQIVFKSHAPISFTTFLELFDEFGEKISIPVSCTAENCLLTIYSYLDYQDNKLVVLDNINNIVKILLSNKMKRFEKDISVSASLSSSCHFIKKWCAFELNLEIQNFPHSIIESRGLILQQMISRMTNGRINLKKSPITAEDKIVKMNQTYSIYSDIIATLKNEGAFLNHIRPEFFLNMNDYLLFLVHKGMVIETQQTQFQILSTQSWVVIFYQMFKIFVEPHITQKFISKFNKSFKTQKLPASTIYSQPEINIIQALNSFLGEQKMYTFSDQGKIFQVIQKIIQKTFGLTLGQQLANLKISSNNMPFHDFMIILSKFLHHHLQQFGLAMYINPTDFFTMGPKQFLLFFISFISHSVHFQNFEIVQFSTAVSEKTIKTIELENPSKTKQCKYWVKIFGSENFQPEVKQISIDPKNKVSLNIEYHCKSIESQEARLVLVPIQNQEGFNHSHSLSFLLKNYVFSKIVVKKMKINASLYEIRNFNFTIDLPLQNIMQTEFMVSISEKKDQYINEMGFSNFYLMQPGKRSIKQGKDRCEIKFAPLTTGKKICHIVYCSETGSQYIFEITADVFMPVLSQKITLQPLITDKQEKRRFKIPKDNYFMDQCMKFHRQILMKTKPQDKKNENTINGKKAGKNKKKMMYLAYFESQTYFTFTKDVCTFDSIQEDNDYLEIKAIFSRPFKQYSSQFFIESEDKKDIRRYQIQTHISVKPKIIHLKSTIKARQTTKILLVNKISHSTFYYNQNTTFLRLEKIEQSNDLLAIFQPQWIMQNEMIVKIENKDSFQLCIYKIQLEATKPDPVSQITLQVSRIFTTQFSIDLDCYNIDPKNYEKINFKTDLLANHELSIDKDQRKIKGIIMADDKQGFFSLKVWLPQKQGYYEYKLCLKNSKVIQLPTIELKQKLFTTKTKAVESLNIALPSFECFYSQDMLNYKIQQSTENSKGAKRLKKQLSLLLLFRPTKQINVETEFYFKNDSKQYKIKIKLISQPFQMVILPLLKAINVQPAKSALLIMNSYDTDGHYDIVIEHPHIFSCDKLSFEIKQKQKISLKVAYTPTFIGENKKSFLKLKSDKLPQLTYCLEGISIMQVEKQEIEVQCYQNSNVSEKIVFTNYFLQKEKFKFEICQKDPSQKVLLLKKDLQSFTEELVYKKTVEFDIKCFSHSTVNCKIAQIIVSKGTEKKIVKQITVKILVVKDLLAQDFNWQCKARETVFETIKFSQPFIVKELKADAQIKKCLSFSEDQQNINEIKLKFTSLKPIKGKKYNILLITDSVKFRIGCFIKVTQPTIDDTITIRTDQVKQIKTAVFRLTNIIRESAPFKAYFANSYQQLEVQPSHGILQAYGKTGTPLYLRFGSQINNKKVQDKLYVETDQMLWVFRVIGIQNKILKF